MIKHENFRQYLDSVQLGSVFVEIGSERGEGSTAYLSNLAKSFFVKLISVDLKDLNSKKQDILSNGWAKFYGDVRAPEWPEAVPDLQGLPSSLQNECIVLHGWLEYEQHLLANFCGLDNVIEVGELGSSWSANYGKKYKDPISLLYLDNFDYIWNIKNIPEFIQNQIVDYKKYHQIEMNNENCQVEHFTQLINLYPYLAKNCLVGFDDTYQLNDCWVGKSGPGVVFLLSQGWQIVHKANNFVIMRRS